MNLRTLLLTVVLLSAVSSFAGSIEQNPPSPNEEAEIPFRFAGEFTIEQAYIGGAEVKRDNRTVNDFDEYYSNLLFVYTPRINVGILRVGGQWERYSFGYPD